MEDCYSEWGVSFIESYKYSTLFIHIFTEPVPIGMQDVLVKISFLNKVY